MKCWRCGAGVAKDAVVCKRCGANQTRNSPVSEIGKELRKQYDQYDADTILGKDEKIILDALSRKKVSSDICAQFRSAIQAGLGKSYLKQIRVSGLPDRDFYKSIHFKLMNNTDLSEESINQLIAWFDEMIGWSEVERKIKTGAVFATKKEEQHNAYVRIFNGRGNDHILSEEEVQNCRKAAEQGDGKAQNAYGELLRKGNGIGVVENAREAAKWFKKSAKQGNIDAQTSLGTCYRDGYGVEQNYKEAAMWYRKAADRGGVSAQNSLGCCYMLGWGVDIDKAKAFQYFRRAADQGHLGAMRNVAVCYQSGSGVAMDKTEAMKWYIKAAESGDTDSQWLLGRELMSDAKSMNDVKKAVTWFHKAAQLGNENGQYYMGLCCESGIVVEKDLSQAAKWFKKAAEQGLASAQYELGTCYLQGLGVKKDKEKAEKWLRRAAEQGDEDALKRMKQLH